MFHILKRHKTMHELSAILEYWRHPESELNDAVLVTVVHVQGSAYRRPGARMLILAGGSRIGTISGGCLESDVVRKAWWWTEQGACIRVFDNTTEDAAWDFGLGCNGVITVLLERLETPTVGALLAFLDEHQSSRRTVVTATVVAVSEDSPYILGERVLYADPVNMLPASAGGLADLLAYDVARTFSETENRLLHLPQADVFLEWHGPPQRLFMFGAGHDALPLAAIAHLNGWQLIIADFRAATLDAERFPLGIRLFAVPASGDISELNIAPADAVVLMTHNYPQDLLLLPQLLAVNPRYLGLLGPKVRAEMLFTEIGSQLAEMENVYAPIGLDIGGDQPQNIAVSIVAEIQAVLSGRNGGHLRRRQQAIHSPALQVGISQSTPRHAEQQQIVSSCSFEHA